MSKSDIFNYFQAMFPDLSTAVISFKKIGSKTISLNMRNGKSLVFLYSDKDNWNLGTKQWRKRPEPIRKE